MYGERERLVKSPQKGVLEREFVTSQVWKLERGKKAEKLKQTNKQTNAEK